MHNHVRGRELQRERGRELAEGQGRRALDLPGFTPHLDHLGRHGVEGARRVITNEVPAEYRRVDRAVPAGVAEHRERGEHVIDELLDVPVGAWCRQPVLVTRHGDHDRATGPVQPAHDGAFGDVEDAGRLGVGEPVDVDEGNDVLEVFGQRRHGGVDDGIEPAADADVLGGVVLSSGVVPGRCSYGCDVPCPLAPFPLLFGTRRRPELSDET